MARKSDIQYVQFYTDGSAARKLEIVRPERQPRKKPVQRTRRRKRIVIHVDPVAIVGTVLAFSLLFVMGSGFRELHAAKQQVRDMETYVQIMEADNILMEKTVREGYDLDQVREQAEAIGLVPEEEVEHIEFHDEAPAQPLQRSLWEQIKGFFTELFA